VGLRSAVHAHLATLDNKDPSDPNGWGAKNICTQLSHRYLPNSILGVHVFRPGIDEGDIFYYPLYIGDLIFEVATSTDLILEQAPDAYYDEHPGSISPFGVTFITGALR
jgi:hypothetical protein